MDITVTVAHKKHAKYAHEVCTLIEEAAQIRGTGIAKRDVRYIRNKMTRGDAVVALCGDKLAGFCYIETWEHERYIAFSGLIVHPDFRKLGIARKIKRRAFELAREKFPASKIFLITTSLAVMKIASELGYEPVTFSELPREEMFWKGCQSCPNYDILTRTNKAFCLCTGMLFEPVKGKNSRQTEDIITNMNSG